MQRFLFLVKNNLNYVKIFLNLRTKRVVQVCKELNMLKYLIALFLLFFAFKSYAGVDGGAITPEFKKSQISRHIS